MTIYSLDILLFLFGTSLFIIYLSLILYSQVIPTSLLFLEHSKNLLYQRFHACDVSTVWDPPPLISALCISLFIQIHDQMLPILSYLEYQGPSLSTILSMVYVHFCFCSQHLFLLKLSHTHTHSHIYFYYYYMCIYCLSPLLEGNFKEVGHIVCTTVTAVPRRQVPQKLLVEWTLIS